jgi:hypothetical protein
MLMLSLTDIKKEQNYKINVSICNDKLKGIFSNLGDTQYETGNPVIFSDTFLFEYYFEKEQMLKFKFITNEVNFDELFFQTTVGKIMGSPKATLTTPIHNKFGEKLFDFVINGKNAVQSKLDINLSIKADITLPINTPSISYFIYNFNDDKNWRGVYKSSEYPSKKINFEPVPIPLDMLCNGDRDKLIQISFFDENMGLIGNSTGSLNDIKQNNNRFIMDENKNSVGYCTITFTEEKTMKFLDYITDEKMQMSLMVGIDFTNSNGDPNTQTSLHYCKGAEPNAYERAIRECGSILAYYDYDQLFPVFGFGAIPPSDSSVNHCFPISCSTDINCNGIDEIIAGYRNALYRVKLFGPTLFYPLLSKVVSMIRETLANDKNIYYVVMILTDGQINDMDQTINILMECAMLPLSIIIIGIGNSDFSNMRVLGILK